MAEVAHIKLPLFTEYDSKRVELGEFEIPVHVNTGKAPGGYRSAGGGVRVHLEPGEEIRPAVDVEAMTHEIKRSMDQALQ